MNPNKRSIIDRQLLLLIILQTTALLCYSVEGRILPDDVQNVNTDDSSHHQDLTSGLLTDGGGGSQRERPHKPSLEQLMEALNEQQQEQEHQNDQNSEWKGRWFPAAPGASKKKDLAKDKHGRIQMGVPSDQCDDGKTNLTLDWDGSAINYTCFHPETRFPMDEYLEPKQECVALPSDYMPDHFCMDEPISYNHSIPTHGDHRPLWPKFGEYMFVPRERWLHNIEHGAVVMLYHPCAYPSEVDRLRTILTGCYGKHVITPSTLVSRERPLALVAWGCRLEMSLVDDDLSRDFIRQKALHGPEGNYTKEGQFEHGLIKFANESGNAVYDRVIC